MTGKEMEKALIKLNWNNKEASNMLGITVRTIYNTIRKDKIPLYIEKLLLLYIKIADKSQKENEFYLDLLNIKQK